MGEITHLVQDIRSSPHIGIKSICREFDPIHVNRLGWEEGCIVVRLFLHISSRVDCWEDLCSARLIEHYEVTGPRRSITNSVCTHCQ